MELRSLTQIANELERRGIHFERKKGRIDTELTVKGHMTERAINNTEFKLVYFNSDGIMFSAIVNISDDIYDDYFSTIPSEKCLGYADDVSKIKDCWRVIKIHRSNSTVEEFVQDGIDYLAEMEEYLKRVTQNEYMWKLESKILTGNLKEFAKTLTGVEEKEQKEQTCMASITGQTNDNINIKAYWKENQEGTRKIIKMIIRKGSKTSQFYCNWNQKMNVQKFFNDSLTAFRAVYGLTEK